MLRPRLSLLITAAAVVCPVLIAYAQGKGRFEARLATVPVDFVNKTTITGSGAVTAELEGSTLSLTGTFEGLGSPATLARLHSGNGATGVRGPAFADVTVSKGVSGKISGSVVLKPPQVAALEGGRVYIQIHSEKAPDGNLWGWLLRSER
jgi:hypothetical protein